MGDSIQACSRGAAAVVVYAVIGYVASFGMLVVAETQFGMNFTTIPKVGVFLEYSYAPIIWPIAHFFGGASC